jgi:hypothetical protein
MMEILSINKLIPHTYGGPRYCIENSAASVQMRISCRVSVDATTYDPYDRRVSPDWFKVDGTHSNGLSASDQRIKSGSKVSLKLNGLYGLDPNAIQKLPELEVAT